MKVKRGPAERRSQWTSTPLWKHLERHHSAEFKAAQDSGVLENHQTKRRKVYVNGTITLQTLIDRKVKYPADHPKQMELTRYLAEWISDAVLPFAVVKNSRFMHFLEKLNPRFDCPSEKVLRQKIFLEVFEKLKGHVVSILETDVGENASLTTDLWTSPTNNSFISLTLHYLDADFQQKMVVLGCFPFDESHEGSAIQERINGIVEEYGLFQKIHLVEWDNAANVVAALSTSQFDHIGCFLHILQLVVVHAVFMQSGVDTVMKKAKRIVKFFNKSPHSTQQLRKCLRDLKLPELELVQGCKTRWSSYYNMLEVLLKVKPGLIRVQTEIDYDTLYESD